ncbi:hypothetical protein KC19_3G059100 [Ceratodon purpureus]|uniref:PORR domain-containing protein n=1 Tax=Ceratodon purpureus TaxID=3225 RepID=A0A8T0IFD3_CERPU|nr:hypothetical protein KC19_3G059100 [Ceratodon purpureus]
MSAMAARRLLIRHPCGFHLRGLRTQAWPDGDEESGPKRVSRFKGRTVREIIRYSEEEFDNAAAKQQELRNVMQVRALLGQRPGRLMDVSELSALHPNLAEAVRDYPGVFKVVDYGAGSSLLCFTAEAEALLKQEESLREEMEARSVRVLRKLLMLSVDRRLSLGRVGFWATDFGLPDDLSDLVSRYREFFELSTTLDYTTWVSLALWDPALAVSYAEIEDRQRQAGTMTQMEMWTPKGYVLSKRHRKVLARFREAPFVSPYTDYRDLESLKMKFEKHAVAGMQELLNLTLYKSLMLSTLAEFKTEFSFSRKPLDLVLRHPEYFYVSPVGKQETVFLRSAYRSGELVKKSPLVLIREQFVKLLDKK